MPSSSSPAHVAEFVEHSLCEIWNRKQIGKIYDVYQHNVELHTPDGRLYGREAVVRSVTSRLAAFPNLTYTVEDLICTGGEQDASKVAVRWAMKGENAGYTRYGPPTGREVFLRGMSHFLLRDDRIVQQWAVDDELGLIQQLGLDASDLAVRLAAGDTLGARPWANVERVFGQTTPEPMSSRQTKVFDVEDFIRRSRHRIWNWRLLATIEELYGEGATFHGPSDLRLDGRDGFAAYVLSMMVAFPDLAMFIDDVLWSEDGQGRYRVSCRWVLLGTHRGPGPYGPPSGNRVRLTGITNNLIREGQIVEQWSVVGEFALLKQIHRSPPRSAEVLEEKDADQSSIDTQQDMSIGDDAGNGNAREQ